MTGQTESGLARAAQILTFLLKYRDAGIFTGLDMDSAAGLAPDMLEDSEDARPEAFVRDLEAL